MKKVKEKKKGTSILVHSMASQLPVPSNLEESEASLRDVARVARFFGISMPASSGGGASTPASDVRGEKVTLCYVCVKSKNMNTKRSSGVWWG